MDEAGTWSPGCLWLNPLLDLYDILYFSYKYPIEEHSIQTYISLSQFSGVNEGVKQASEWPYENRNTKKTVA
jgi:hypothetical protein